LTLDRLELDPWLPANFSPTGPIPPWLSALDVDLRLDVKQAMLKGVGIAPLSLDTTVEAGRLTLRKLDATVNGVHATASGTLAGDGRISDARLDIQAPQASALADLLPSSLGLWRAPVPASGMVRPIYK